jgi:hypothetical protein
MNPMLSGILAALSKAESVPGEVFAELSKLAGEAAPIVSEIAPELAHLETEAQPVVSQVKTAIDATPLPSDAAAARAAFLKLISDSETEALAVVANGKKIGQAVQASHEGLFTFLKAVSQNPEIQALSAKALTLLAAGVDNTPKATVVATK